MSDWKLFTKSKSAELKAELEQAFKKSKPHNRVKIVLKKVIANIILNNNELVNLMPDIILLMKIDDLEIRKMCFQYLVNYCQMNVKESLNAIPFLSRLKDDNNSQLRALTIKTLSSINITEFTDLAFRSVKKLLRDDDLYVRRMSIFAIARLYSIDPNRCLDYELIEDLNELLYDSNQMIVSNVLAALDDITQHSKNLTLTIDERNVYTLIKFLNKTNEWNQIYILNSLMSYAPNTTEESLQLIENIMPLLQHENSSVVLNSIKVIIFYSNYVSKPELIIPTLPKRLGSSLVSLLSKPSEIQFLVLRNVILLLLGQKKLVSFEVEMFFCKYDDPIYVKDTKLEIIYLLANEFNVEIVLRELEEYATEVDVAMARKAIRAFGNLAIKINNAANKCVDVLCDLISNGIAYIVEESTIVIKNILRKYPGKFNFAVEELVRHYKVINEPDAKTAMIWILGQYCQLIPVTNIILEEFIQSFKDDPVEVQYATLTSVIKYYLHDPVKGQPIVIKVLKWATEDIDNPDIRDRGYFYWRLISSDEISNLGNFQSITKEIIINNNPIISADNDNIDPNILIELELNIGTLASIYLKPVQQVFRLAKHKKLPKTNALQERSLPSLNDDPQYSNPNSNPNSNSNSNPSSTPTSNHNSMSTFHPQPPRRHSTMDRNSRLISQGSFDDEFSSNDESAARKNSFAKRLSRKASIITGRKNSKH